MPHIARRTFLLATAAAVVPSFARAQQSTMPTVGFLNGASYHLSEHLVRAYREQRLPYVGAAGARRVRVVRDHLGGVTARRDQPVGKAGAQPRGLPGRVDGVRDHREQAANEGQEDAVDCGASDLECSRCDLKGRKDGYCLDGACRADAGATCR